MELTQLAAVVVAARAGVISAPSGVSGLVAPVTWALAAYMALNSMGNLTSKSQLERTVFAATTAILAVLTAYVALTGTG